MIPTQKLSARADMSEREQAISKGPSPGSMLRSFSKDRRGSVAIIFALMIYPVLMLVGFGVDFSRTLAVRVRMQTIMDAAALAGARAAQTAATSEILAKADEAAKAYFNAQDIGSVVPGSKSLGALQANSAKTEFTWEAQAWIQTPFMNAASMLVNKAASPAAAGISQCSQSWWSCQQVKSTAAALLQSGKGDSSIEVSIMLDITGSMGGNKIADLKLAAKDAVDILVWADQSKATSRVALVPFAEDVRLPTLAAFQKAVGTSNVSTATSGTGLKYASVTTTNKDGETKTKKYYQPKDQYCVVERPGTNKYSDITPNATNGYSLPRRFSKSDDECDVPSAAAIQPLTSNKTTLNTKIDALSVVGATAGQIGTAWAWYTLSPDWNDLWDADENKPKAYGTEKLKKIAILMTDGDYNTQYDQYGVKTSGSGVNGDADQQAPQLCTGMKAKNIEVFAVGFMVSSDAETLLKNCATDISHYYAASNGEALRMAFRDIALKISTLRLSK
ncbi:MAG: TadE/TadG family protein [Hyphomicrobiaceae bacterium]|nr:TadE/TadG family protein [Hyphomicrobiaceae bacterium]